MMNPGNRRLFKIHNRSDLQQPTTASPISTSAASDRPLRHLNQVDLARRWNLSPRTLERRRWRQRGPVYLKVGGRVVYRLEDIEAFEAAHLRQLTGGVQR